jgi:hypothetical protein
LAHTLCETTTITLYTSSPWPLHCWIFQDVKVGDCGLFY